MMLRPMKWIIAKGWDLLQNIPDVEFSPAVYFDK